MFRCPWDSCPESWEGFFFKFELFLISLPLADPAIYLVTIFTGEAEVDFKL